MSIRSASEISLTLRRTRGFFPRPPCEDLLLSPLRWEMFVLTVTQSRRGCVSGMRSLTEDGPQVQANGPVPP